MGSFNFAIPRPDRSLADSLAAVPRSFKQLARRGFVILAGVGQQHYAELLRAVVITLESRQPPFDDLEKSLSLTKEDLNALMAATMITVPLLTSGGTIEEFFSGCVKAEMIAPELIPNITPFLEVVVSERTQFSRTLRRTSMPSQVLPFLTEFEVAIDVRISFEDQTVDDSVPVAIVHVDTDQMGEKLWFQASKTQMQRLKADIDVAIRRMEAAEAWARKASTS